MRSLCACAISMCLGAAAAAGGAFYALGATVPGVESLAWKVSADGSTVVGNDGAGPFVWTLATGLQPFTLPHPGAINVGMRGVSADGAILMGAARIDGVNRGWRLGPGGELDIISRPDGLSLSAMGMSDDGSTVVGRTSLGNDSRAFRWTPDDGYTLLTDALGIEAYAASADGASIVGGPFPPFLWRDGSGIEPLQSPADAAPIVYAYAVSADGATAAGEATDGNIASAIVWESGLPSVLPPLPGATYSAVYAASGSAEILAGRSSLTGFNGFRAAVWDETRRVIDPNAYFDSIGLDRGGLHLTVIRGVSHDGRTLTGWGERDTGEGPPRREAWVAVLDRPVSCAADLNNDGSIGFADLNALLSSFGCVGEGCEGDINADGAVNFADLNELLWRFGVRCYNPAPAQ